MTEKIDGRTKRALDMTIAKKQISRASYDAVLAGTLTLAEAKSLGRDRGPDTIQASSGQRTATRTQGRSGAGSPDAATDGPPQPVSRISKNDTLSPCLCGCGELTARRFKPGHDMRLHTYAKEYVRGERELTDEQLEYVEQSGKLAHARQQIEKEEARRQVRIAKKTEAQRKKEAEAKKQNAK